jgi:Fe2+ transport system protein B
MRQKQEENSRTIHLIRKHLLQHVKDMHVWKVFLDQGKEYDAEDLHTVMEPELQKTLSFEVQMTTLDKAITEENTKLDELHQERIKAEKEQMKDHQSVPVKKEEHKVPIGSSKDKDKKKKKEIKKT